MTQFDIGDTIEQRVLHNFGGELVRSYEIAKVTKSKRIAYDKTGKKFRLNKADEVTAKWFHRVTETLKLIKT